MSPATRGRVAYMLGLFFGILVGLSVEDPLWLRLLASAVTAVLSYTMVGLALGLRVWRKDASRR